MPHSLAQQAATCHGHVRHGLSMQVHAYVQVWAGDQANYQHCHHPCSRLATYLSCPYVCLLTFGSFAARAIARSFRFFLVLMYTSTHVARPTKMITPGHACSNGNGLAFTRVGCCGGCEWCGDGPA